MASTFPILAQAQGSAFRCVDAEGQVSYQQVPCPVEAEQRTVKVVDALPTLTLEEQFRAEAQRLGLSPGEYAQRLEASGQVWTPEGTSPLEALQAQDAPERLPCIRPDGQVYFARPGTCPGANSSISGIAPAGLRQRDADSEALTARAARSEQAAQGEGESVGAGEDACNTARQEARERRDAELGLSYDERSRLDDRVWAACRGR
jgi:hypothetical protein